MNEGQPGDLKFLLHTYVQFVTIYTTGSITASCIMISQIGFLPNSESSNYHWQKEGIKMD